ASLRLSARLPSPSATRARRHFVARPACRSEEHTSELQSRRDLVCRLLLEKKKGDTKTEHVLKPMQVLSGICAKGCTVHLDDDEEEEYQLESEDVVSIEEGSLYYDTPETPAGPAPAPGTGTSKPGNKG